MRFLHTSDWHVGKTLRGRSRIEEQSAVLAQIQQAVVDEAVDVVLIAGDLFDTPAPAPEAERVVYRALLDLADTGATVVVLAGNHDSERKFRAVAPLLARGRIEARGTLGPPIEVQGSDGSSAIIGMLPWIGKHHLIRAAEAFDLDPATISQEYQACLKDFVAKLCEPMRDDTVNILAGHVAMHFDGDIGEEVRKAHVFDYAISSAIFPASLHYVALGHYHRMIDVGGPCPIRYSGAPMWLGFPRAEHERDDKGVLIVDAVPGTPARIRFHPITAGRRLRTLRGTLTELESMQGSADGDWLRIYVREQARAGIAAQVREWFPDAVEVAVDTPDADDDGGTKPSRSGRAPSELFRDYLTDRAAADERVAALFDSLLQEAYAPDPA